MNDRIKEVGSMNIIDSACPAFYDYRNRNRKHQRGIFELEGVLKIVVTGESLKDLSRKIV